MDEGLTTGFDKLTQDKPFLPPNRDSQLHEMAEMAEQELEAADEGLPLSVSVMEGLQQQTPSLTMLPEIKGRIKSVR